MSKFIEITEIGDDDAFLINADTIKYVYIDSFDRVLRVNCGGSDVFRVKDTYEEIKKKLEVV